MNSRKAEEVFEQAVLHGAKRLGLDLSETGVYRLKTHRRVLLRWASKVNLTTVLEPQDMAEHLYLDSAILLPHLREHVQLHDVGTGAGFPGLVLKALMPTLRVTLTEARQKKVAFLKQAAYEMDLSTDLEFIQGRIGWQQLDFSDQWHEVVSRAAFPPKEWVKIGSQLVAPGGRLWIFLGQPKGYSDQAALRGSLTWLRDDLPPGFELESILCYRLLGLDKERRLVSLRRW